jgi:hypothetical protein
MEPSALSREWVVESVVGAMTTMPRFRQHIFNCALQEGNPLAA